MRRALKIAAWSAAGLLGFVAVLVGALLIIGNTNSGRALAVRLTAQLTDGHVRLAGIRGSFPAALDLDRLELSDDNGVWLFAERISLRWTPSALLTRHILVDTLHVGRLHIERAPLPEEESKPERHYSIPHSDLTRLSIDTLELGPALAGAEVSLVVQGSAHLRSLEDATAALTAHRTGGLGDYELQLQFDPARMDASLKLQEPANGPLENLLRTPGLGDLSVLAQVHGPRNAEQIQLSVSAGALRGSAQGTINLTDTSADLQYSLRAPPMSPFEGLSWQSIDLQGRWHGTIREPSADGRLRALQLQVPGGVRVGSLNVSLTASGGLVTMRSVIEELVLPGPRPDLLQDSPLTLDASLRLNEDSRPLELTASHRLLALQAHVVTAGNQQAQLELHLPDVAPLAALGGQKVRGDANIKAQLAHDPKSTQLKADINASIDGGTAVWASLLRGGSTRLQVDGSLSEDSVTIDRLRLDGRAVTLAGSGSLGRTGAQKLDARLDLNLSDLSRVSPALAGTAKLIGKASGPLKSLSVESDLTTTLSVHGSSRGTVYASVHADGLPSAPRGTVEAHGDLDGSPLVLNALVQQLEGGSMHAVIQHADWKSAHAQADITSGAEFAQAHGTVQWRMSELADMDRLLGTALQGSVAGNLSLVPSAGHSKVQLLIDAHDVVAGGVTADAHLTGDGPLDALNLTLAAQSPALAGAPATVNATARLNATDQHIDLSSAEATWQGQTLKLLSAARVSFADGLRLDGVRLGAGQAVLQADGKVSPDLDIQASLQQVRPELINAFVPGLLASGTLQADARIQGSPAAPTGTLKVDVTGLRAANDAARGLPATDIHVSAQLMGNTAAVDGKLNAGSASRLALAGQAPLAADGALDLKLTGSLDLGLLNPLLEARGRHVTGALTVDTTVTGTAGSPEIGGTVKLVKGTLRDYTQGTNLSDINGELSGEHGTLRIEHLTARAAPGNVSVEGTVGVLQPQIPVDLKITANKAQPIANNIITANLNADIKVTGTAREQLQVAGRIDINRADVEIPSGLPPNVAVLDVRRPGRAKPPPPVKPLVIGLDITVSAPRQILVKGRGLDAELGGEIRVRGTTDTPAVSGGFELQRGFFSLASSKLTFTNGNVTFNGAGLKNRIDPTLDFTAQSVVADVTAIVRITGLADQPKIELSSTPELPQDEILARLLFGESASQLTALQVVQIGAALTTLGGGGGGFNPVAKIQKALGLDRLTVGGGTSNGAPGTQNNSGATIEAGRYVSSRVFVAVKETTTGASQLAVDVDLTRHLKLQTRLGNGTATAQGTTPENDPGSSVGLAYQFEY
ncbi:MAG TPA: translocation/assembly module TamB domain-containing protein [Steroidobacteraceae bacterium]|nr:translocation/assembly module TamB domain-containing protein [Steroidobacteraceae bacterium]